MIKGLDLSVYQEGINFDFIKNENYDFLILRAGFTGYGTGVSYNKDKCFESFYSNAKLIGLNVGCYWYSCANNYEKGVAEANFMYENCLKGKQFEYPIYIDVENDKWQKNKIGTTSAIRGFCETLEKLGYYVGIYANLNYFTNYIDTSSLKMYDKWVALWRENLNKPRVGFDFGLWQYSSKGSIGGYVVDTNISYRDYPTIIKNANLNGFKKENKINGESLLNSLGYKNLGKIDNGNIKYKKDNDNIWYFDDEDKTVYKSGEYDGMCDSITMGELNAICQMLIDKGWLDVNSL